MAKTTAMAKGVNRNLAAPVSNTTGTKTMQMESEETKVGTAICCAPSSSGARQRLAHGHVAMHVFDGDRGVVHQDAHGQRHAAQGHDVDGFPERAENDLRSQDGERNRGADDERAAPAPQEEQDHQAGQQRGDDALFQHAVDRGAHEQRLIEERSDPQRRRQDRQHPRQRRLDLPHDVQRGSVAVAQDRHQRGAIAVDAHHVDLRQKAAAHLGHIFHQHHGPAGRPDRQLIHLSDGQRAAVQANRVFAIAHLDRTARQNQVLVRDRVGDIGRRQMLGI